MLESEELNLSHKCSYNINHTEPSVSGGFEGILATFTPDQRRALESLTPIERQQLLGRAPTASHQEPSLVQRSEEASIPMNSSLFHGRSHVAEVQQDRKRKACSPPFSPLSKFKTTRKNRASARYEMQKVKTTNARNMRDIHLKSLDFAKEGLEMLLSKKKLEKKKLAKVEDEEEKAKRALRIMTYKKALLYEELRINVS